MDVIYRGLKRELPAIMRKAGSSTAFQARVFSDLRVLSRALNAQMIS